MQKKRSSCRRARRTAADRSSSAGIGTVTLARTGRSSCRARAIAATARRSSSARAAESSPKGLHASRVPAGMAPLGGRATAGDRDLAGPDHLDEPERADHPLEGLDLVVRARYLDRHRALRDVDHLAAEDVRELHDLSPARALRGPLDQ